MKAGCSTARRRVAVAIFGLVLLGALPVTSHAAFAQAEQFQEGECQPVETVPPPGQELYKGTDPARDLLLYNPERLLQYPCPYPREYRGVEVGPDELLLVEGGQLVRRVRTGASGVARTYTFAELATLIGNPEWLGEVAPGVFQLDAAIVQEESTLLITAPRVREVRMTTRPHVYIGGSRANVLFEGVKVTSWEPTVNGPDLNPVDGRPFINYEQSSRLDIGRSEFTHLGSDRTGAYGVSWRTGGTTGRVFDSVFANNFFGAYTFEATNIEFRRNVFRDNAYYGLDPHTGSKNLIVEDNEAFGNGTHGMIFSQHVTDSVMRNNRVHDNGANGIVLHAGSDRNRVEGNLVEANHEDGIVVIGSGHSAVERNTVRRNRTGIRVNDLGSDRVSVAGNLVEDSGTGIKVYGGATEAMVADNVIRGSRDNGILVEAPLSRLVRNQIVGAQRGLDLESVVDVADSDVSQVSEGILARSSSIVEMRNVKVAASRMGVRIEPGAVTTMHGVELNAPTTVAQRAIRPSSWTDLLPFVGIGAVMSAIALDVLRRARNRHQPQVQAPEHVLNSA